MNLEDAIAKACDEATKQLKIEELESELNEWKRWCKERERALDDLAKAFSQQQDRIKRLEEAGDAMFPWSERVGQEFWTKAKEAKP